MAARPEVPEEWVRRLRALLVDGFPECVEENAWVGVRWHVGQATIAHVFGGEDGRFRITFRAEPDEVMAFQHLGHPYFKAGWGANVVGIVLDDKTDWSELAELLTDSYCVQAPATGAAGGQADVKPGGDTRPSSPRTARAPRVGPTRGRCSGTGGARVRNAPTAMLIRRQTKSLEHPTAC